MQPDGITKWALPDGTIAETFPNGDKILSLPNGQREIHTADHKVSLKKLKNKLNILIKKLTV